MFRVVENEDGTTSIFCKTSGRHVFTTPASQPRIPERTTVNRPINVVVPSPQPVWLDRPHSSDDPAFKTTSGQDLDIFTRKSKCCISPIPISLDSDQTEDYFEDCITQSEFARCLNLIPTEKFNSEPLSEILIDYPLRLLSRSKAYRSTKDSPEDLRFQKPPDDVPLSSNLGVKILNLNENRNFMNEQKLSIAIKKYDAFCRFPFNTPNPVDCNFPKLRCREKKFYPTLTSTKASKHEPTHFYTYGRRQRLERMRTLRTGLDKESRQLLRMCSAKRCSVLMKKLDYAEIKYWLEKKSEPIIVVIDDDDDDDVTSCSIMPSEANFNDITLNDMMTNQSSRNAKSCINEPSVEKRLIQQNTSKKTGEYGLKYLIPSTSSEYRLPNGPNKPSTYKYYSPYSRCTLKERKLARNKGCRKCYIKLTNVSQLIHKYKDDYFVRGTQIRVPFYSSYLRSISARDSGASISLCKESIRSMSADHSYVCQIPESISFSRHSVEGSRDQMMPVKSQNKTLNRSRLPQMLQRSCSVPLQSRGEGSSVNTLKIIPVVDLTEDSSPESNSNQYLVPKRYLVTQWLFRCFACGFKRLFYNESNPTEANNIVDSSISEHMRSFHFVDRPEAFLSSYLDSRNNRKVIEAFPGYKRD